MKLRFSLLLVVLFNCLGAVSSTAQTVTGTWYFTDLIGHSNGVTSVTITPINTPYTPNATFLLARQLQFSKASYPNLTNGFFTTNVYMDIDYRVSIADSWTVTTYTNYFYPSDSNTTINAYFRLGQRVGSRFAFFYPVLTPQFSNAVANIAAASVASVGTTTPATMTNADNAFTGTFTGTFTGLGNAARGDTNAMKVFSATNADVANGVVGRLNLTNLPVAVVTNNDSRAIVLTNANSSFTGVFNAPGTNMITGGGNQSANLSDLTSLSINNTVADENTTVVSVEGRATVLPVGDAALGTAIGVRGAVGMGVGIGGFTAMFGVFGQATNALSSLAIPKYGVYGLARGNGTNWAGFFDGNSRTIGTNVSDIFLGNGTRLTNDSGTAPSFFSTNVVTEISVTGATAIRSTNAAGKVVTIAISSVTNSPEIWAYTNGVYYANGSYYQTSSVNVIQAAIDQLPFYANKQQAGGGTIHLQAGIYDTTNRIVYTNNFIGGLRLIGAGMSATVIKATGAYDLLTINSISTNDTPIYLGLSDLTLANSVVCTNNLVYEMHVGRADIDRVFFTDWFNLTNNTYGTANLGAQIPFGEAPRITGLVGLWLGAISGGELITIRNCEFAGLGSGVVDYSDHSLYLGNSFACISDFLTNSIGNRTYTNGWNKALPQSIGAAIYLGGSTQDDCSGYHNHFYKCNTAFFHDAGSKNVRFHDGVFELDLYCVIGSGGTIYLDNAYPCGEAAATATNAGGIYGIDSGHPYAAVHHIGPDPTTGYIYASYDRVSFSPLGGIKTNGSALFPSITSISGANFWQVNSAGDARFKSITQPSGNWSVDSSGNAVFNDGSFGGNLDASGAISGVNGTFNVFDDGSGDINAFAHWDVAGNITATSFSGSLNASQLASGTVPIARLPYSVTRTNWVANTYWTNNTGGLITVFSDELIVSAALGNTGFMLFYDPAGGHNWQTNCNGVTVQVATSIGGMTNPSRMSGPVATGGVICWTNLSTVGSATLQNGYYSSP